MIFVSLYSSGMLGTEGMPLFASGTTANGDPGRKRPGKWNDWNEDIAVSTPSIRSVLVGVALVTSALR